MYMRLCLHVLYKVATVANKLSSNVFSTPSCVNQQYHFCVNGSCCNHQGTVAKLNKVNFIQS